MAASPLGLATVTTIIGLSGDAGGWPVLRLNEFGETNRISFILWDQATSCLAKVFNLLRKSVWQGVTEAREGLSFCLSLPLDDLAGGSTAFGSPAFRFPCTQLLTGSRAARGAAEPASAAEPYRFRRQAFRCRAAPGCHRGSRAKCRSRAAIPMPRLPGS